jgi:hypothetical protein
MLTDKVRGLVAFPTSIAPLKHNGTVKHRMRSGHPLLARYDMLHRRRISVANGDQRT